MSQISGVSGTNINQTGASTASTQLNQDFDDFLTLLTTQLQNQDPLSPMDSTEFTNQLVSFSGVEQQIRSNDTLNKLLSMQTLNLTAVGLSFIGKDVEITGEKFASDGSGTNEMTLGYTMPPEVKTGTVTITDKDGNVVYTSPANLAEGRHTFTWDGKTTGGAVAPAGTYQLNVAALDANKTSLVVTKYVPGHVDSLESMEDGSLVLVIDGRQVALSDVRKVSEPSS